MGIAERRERQKAELRERILAAAKHIVVTEGLPELTMRKIADAIEYSPATIYLHFQNRDEIALQLVRDGFAALIGYMAPAAAIPDPLARVRAIAKAYIAFGVREPETYRLIFLDTYAWALWESTDEAKEPENGAFSFLAGTFQEAIDAGSIHGMTADRAAELLWASLHGIVSLKLSCAKYPFDDIALPGEQMCDLVLAGLMHRHAIA